MSKPRAAALALHTKRRPRTVTDTAAALDYAGFIAATDDGRALSFEITRSVCRAGMDPAHCYAQAIIDQFGEFSQLVLELSQGFQVIVGTAFMPGYSFDLSAVVVRNADVLALLRARFDLREVREANYTCPRCLRPVDPAARTGSDSSVSRALREARIGHRPTRELVVAHAPTVVGRRLHPVKNGRFTCGACGLVRSTPIIRLWNALHAVGCDDAFRRHEKMIGDAVRAGWHDAQPTTKRSRSSERRARQ